MKNISLIAATVLALGRATAQAETETVPGVAPTEPTAPPTFQPAPPTFQPAPPEMNQARRPVWRDPWGEGSPASVVEVSTPPVTDAEMNVTPIMVPSRIVERPVLVVHRDPSDRSWTSRTGGALFVGGGFQDFTNSQLRSMTGSGGYWSVRAVGGMRRIVGMEAAYVGDARDISALGLSSNSSAHLVSNGLETALRLNIPMMSPNQTSLFEPFGFVGLGWSHYNLTNVDVNRLDVASRDDIMTMPFGGGFAFGSGAFMADVRFTYRKTYYNNLVAGENLDNWGVGGQVGFGF